MCLEIVLKDRLWFPWASIIEDNSRLGVAMAILFSQPHDCILAERME